MVHAYPHDLADFIINDWDKDICFGEFCNLDHGTDIDPLPDKAVLEQLLSTCYQASLLHV